MAEQKGLVVFQAAESEDLTHEEIWDDTLLIQQYDAAMAQVTQKLAKRISAANTTESEQSEANTRPGQEGRPTGQRHTPTSINRKKKKKNKKRINWHTGDYCQAQYTEDWEWYEATITALDPRAARCTVRYLGYNNEEDLPLHTLHKSRGEGARRRQQEAAEDAQSEGDVCSSVMESDVQSQSDTDCERNSKRQRLPSDRRPPQGMMPPPNYPMGGGPCTPPPHLPLLPPPPALTLDASGDPRASEALHTMLMSWYMTGYHTGYYQGLQQAQTKRRTR